MPNDDCQPALSLHLIKHHALPAPLAGLTIQMNFCLSLPAHLSGNSMT